jgi:glycosidase
MYDPAPWLQGDVFDAVMNYRWYMPTRSFFASAPPHLTATQYAEHLDSVARGIPQDQQKAMMNLTASHDTPRFATSVFNPGPYKYRVNPRENPEYRIHRPDDRTRRIQELILVQQYTWLGAPHVWNGDEVGMWGADDPDPRKPIVWPDLAYEDEVADPFGRPRPRDRVAPDVGLRQVYEDLIALRRAFLPLFVDGSLRMLVTDDARRLLAYERGLGEERAVVVFNASDRPVTLALEVEGTRYRAAYPAGRAVVVDDGRLAVDLAPQSAQVWIREADEGRAAAAAPPSNDPHSALSASTGSTPAALRAGR